MRSVFWDDHARDLEDPQYAAAFALESERIQTIDNIMNALDAARVTACIPKTQLAKAVGLGDAAVRRLFSRRDEANPTLDTLVRLSTALGYRVKLERIPEAERQRLDAVVHPHAAHA